MRHRSPQPRRSRRLSMGSSRKVPHCQDFPSVRACTADSLQNPSKCEPSRLPHPTAESGRPEPETRRAHARQQLRTPWPIAQSRIPESQSRSPESRITARRARNSHTQRSRRRATSLISLSFRHSCLSSSICRPMTFSFSSVFWAGRSAVVPPLSRKGRWGKAPCLSPGTRRAVGRLSFLLSFLEESPSDCWLCFLRVSYSELRPRGPCPARLAERRRTRMPLAASPRPRAVRRA